MFSTYPVTTKFVPSSLPSSYSSLSTESGKDGAIEAIDRENLEAQDVNFEDLKKGIKWVESKNGKYMKNSQSTASGLYGQQFSEIENEYEKDRAQFIGDYDAQNDFFRKRFANRKIIFNLFFV